MTEPSLDSILQLVRARTGWELRDEDGGRLRERLWERLAALELTPVQYAGRLEEDHEGTEWEEVMALLSNPETFFFRDSGQIALLRERILPDILLRRRPHRSIRIWSAGCSTGEEPYSLAILLHELAPDLASWQVQILGTDMNAQSIRLAREGRYRDWSFRGRHERLVRYFHQEGDSWKVKDHLRRLVTFRSGNLVQDRYPDARSDLREMDLIICRNVFIYFSRPAVSAVISKMAHTLRDGGYLVTGHSELHGVALPHLPLQPRRFAASLVYQLGGKQSLPLPAKAAPDARTRPAPSRETPAPRPTPRPAPATRTTTASEQPSTRQPGDDGLAALLQSGRYEAVLDEAQKVLADAPTDMETLSLAVRAAANLGRHTWATEACGHAMELAPFAPEPYYFLAQIAEERGEISTAKEHLKKCLYVAPQFIPGYLELAAVYRRERNLERAARMRAAALDVLRKLPAGVPVPGCEPALAGELITHLEAEAERKK